MKQSADMKKITDLSKLKAHTNDDSQFVAMINEVNTLIDKYHAVKDPESAEAKSLKVQIVNYKNKIEKIRKGY